MWSDEDLDQALADQPAGPLLSAEARTRVLSRLRDAQQADSDTVVPLRRRKTWWAAAATLVILAGVALGAAGGTAPAASAAAVVQLDRASAAASGLRAGPGQYFYTSSHAWSLGSAVTRTGKPLSQLQEAVTETWIPHQRAEDWVQVTTVTGRTQWLVGNDDLVNREGDGGLLTPAARTQEHGSCGDFPSHNNELGDLGPAEPCEQRAGDWYTPTPRFLAGLPDDPELLYQRLRADAAAGGRSEMLVLAMGVLTSDASSEVRANLYRALMRMPGLDVTAQAVNLDGRPGVALGVSDDTTRQEIVIDPGTGRLIGQRLVLTAPGTGMWQGLPSGTVADYTAVTTGVVASTKKRVAGA